MHQVNQTLPASATTRAAIHDLRNLFGVVASARHLLDGRQHRSRRKQLLDAIEGAAFRGGELTTSLLARAEQPNKSVDVNDTLVRLQPMILALVGCDVVVRFDLCAGRALVRVDPADLEATLLELVRNARSAARPHGHLVLRTRRLRGRLWLSVADDGIGMDPSQVRKRLASPAPTGAHGTGLIRVRQFAAAAHGRLHVRSRPGLGTVVSLNLPTILTLNVDEPAAPTARHIFNHEEISHEENRQPAAA
jgi:signal transduction histidine kinase